MALTEVLNPTILREYDIRGIVDETLSADDTFNIGRAYGSELIEKGGLAVVVGYDGRISSPRLKKALVKGLVSSGVKVIQIGMGPTPMLNFAAHLLKADGGLMVTGSHNPPNYNGIKMTMFGRAFFGKEIRALGERCNSEKFVVGKGNTFEQNILEKYVDRILRDFSGSRELKIAWDPGNGASGIIVDKVIERLPGTHFLINGTVDGNFPAHHPDPTVEDNLKQLKELVLEKKCEIGIAFDGDGDRLGVVDGLGRVIWGDQLLVILARQVLKELPGSTIIADVKASQVFIDEIKRLGGIPILWKTGHSHIKTKMAELSSPIAGEMSAHLFFKHKYYGFDDGVYAAIRLLSILASGKQTLESIFNELPKMFNTPEIRIDCTEDQKFLVIKEVKKRLKSEACIQVNEVDGVRVSSKDGWWLLRASNTQPALVARCEAETEESLARLKRKLAAVLRDTGVSIKL